MQTEPNAHSKANSPASIFEHHFRMKCKELGLSHSGEAAICGALYQNGKLNLILSGPYFFSPFEIERSLFRLRLFIGLAETMQIFTEQFQLIPILIYTIHRYTQSLRFLTLPRKVILICHPPTIQRFRSTCKKQKKV